MNQNNQNNQNSQSIQNNQSTQNSQNNLRSDLTFLPHHGHYRNLRVYKLAEIIYDITFFFANKYLSKGDRTVDQMIQAARSGKQNIAEGNQAAVTSSETEIKLTNVAKASLEELLTDYEDYLRVRQLQQWGKDHERLVKMRTYLKSQQFIDEYAIILTKLNEEEICNLSITLIHQTMFMLHRLIETMQRRFITEGGIKEQMYKARVSYRNNLSNLNIQSIQSIQNNQNSQNSQNNQNNRNFQNNQ